MPTIGIILLFIVYLIPPIVAWNKKDYWGVLVLDVFLGWTIIGWIAALIWAVQSKPKKS